MDIHLEVCYEIRDCILDTFDGADFGNCFHDVAHAFSFDFNNHIIKAEKLVRF